MNTVDSFARILSYGNTSDIADILERIKSSKLDVVNSIDELLAIPLQIGLMRLCEFEGTYEGISIKKGDIAVVSKSTGTLKWEIFSPGASSIENAILDGGNASTE